MAIAMARDWPPDAGRPRASFQVAPASVDRRRPALVAANTTPAGRGGTAMAWTVVSGKLWLSRQVTPPLRLRKNPRAVPR